MFSHQLFPKDATPGFGGAVHQILTNAETPRPAAAPLPSTPSAVEMLTAMPSRIRAESEEEGKAIGDLLAEIHAADGLARRIDDFLRVRFVQRQTRFAAEAARLNAECRKQNSLCDELKPDLAEHQRWLERIRGELQRARFALETAKDSKLPKWPAPEEEGAREKRIEAAKGEVKKLEKGFADAGESVRQATQKLVTECEKLRKLDEERARVDAFGKGEAFIDPQTHLPILPPA